MYHMTILAVVFILSLAYQIAFIISKRRQRSHGWDEIVKRLRPLDQSVLDDLWQSCSNSCDVTERQTTKVMWARIGGLSGIRDIRANAATMLELAEYAERWNPACGPVFADLVRVEVGRMRRLTFRLCLGRMLLVGGEQFRSTLAATLECHSALKLRVRAIYQECHVGRLSMLIDHL